MLDIKHMIVATGWAAIYESDDSQVARPLVAWAANETEYSSGGISLTGSSVNGLVVNDDGKVVTAESLDGFVTYDYDFDSTSVDYLALKNGN